MTLPAATSNAIPATPNQALQQLLAGNDRFAKQATRRPNQSLSRLSCLRSQQHPFATLVSCSDSRVPPEIIFDQGIGDLFIVRVAGNIITPAELGSCEYGVAVLKTKVLVVLGHSGCGAVNAALANDRGEGQISTLIQAIQPAIALSEQEPGDRLQNAVSANVRVQAQHLLGSAVMTRLLDDRQLKIVGAYFDMQSGNVEILTILTRSTQTIQLNRQNAVQASSIELQITNTETGELRRVTLAFDRGQQCSIGRFPASDLILSAANVSRVHAMLWFDQNRYSLVDCQSRAGTVLNGRLLEPQRRYVLQAGDRLEIGAFAIVVRSIGLEN